MVRCGRISSSSNTFYVSLQGALRAVVKRLETLPHHREVCVRLPFFPCNFVRYVVIVEFFYELLKYVC